MGTPYFQSYLRNVQKVWSVGAVRHDDPLEPERKPEIVGPHQSFEDWIATQPRRVPVPRKTAA